MKPKKLGKADDSVEREPDFVDRLVQRADSLGMKEEHVEKWTAWLFIASLFIIGLPFGLLIFSDKEPEDINFFGWVVYSILAVLVGMFAKVRRQRDQYVWFGWSMIATPLVFILLLILKQPPLEDQKRSWPLTEAFAVLSFIVCLMLYG